jgi:pimeloyl-ACP methyl ester carboxylesterase
MRFLILLSMLAGAILSPSGAQAQTPVNRAEFVRIGGIEQWVTMKGSDDRNPVILFIHGGPGNPLSPYADNLYGSWAGKYTLVQWDQRGAGRSFGRNPKQADETLTVERMAKDGTEVAAYVTRTLGKKKVILVGGSWGAALAVHMAQSRPDLFHAYIGSGQLVNETENAQATYARTLALVKAKGDAKAADMLATMGTPPWTNPRNFGAMRRITRAREAELSQAAPRTWWQPAAEYATPAAQAEYEAGEEYSYIQFVGIKGKGMLSTIDLHKLGTRFELPVYLIHGTHDLVTDMAVAQRYFNAISAPTKEFIVLKNSGHDPNVEMIEAQAAVLAGLRPKLL